MNILKEGQWQLHKEILSHELKDFWGFILFFVPLTVTIEDRPVEYKTELKESNCWLKVDDRVGGRHLARNLSFMSS